MALFNEVEKQIKECMKLKRNPEFADTMVAYENVYKSVKNKALAIAKETKAEMSDEIVHKAIKKEIKELEQTISVSPANSENAKQAIIQKEEIEAYLPKELDDEALEKVVRGIVMTQPQGSNFGLIMKACMAQLAGQADGKRVKAMIEKIIK